MKNLLVLLFAIIFAISFAQPLQTPSGRDRQLILDCLRAKTKRSLKSKPVKFVVQHIKSQDGWAFMSGRCVKPDGTPFEYKGTEYEQYIKEGLFDDWVCALMRKVKGKWQIKAWALGATDVPWAGWWGDFGAPESIFPPHGASAGE